MTEGLPDRKGLSIFDNAPTGGFHVRSRGYDRDQVERYVRKLEDKLREATARGSERAELLTRAEERIGELSGEVTALRSRLEQAEGRLRNVDQPSFSGLGEHVATLLSSAEEQAQSIRDAAAAEAQRIRSEARDETEAARQHAARVRQEAEQAAATLRADADEHARALRAEAEAEARRLRTEAGQDATAARVNAVEEAKALLAQAQAAATELRSAADADAEAQREAAATLLHEARKRADHQVGAVTAGLAALQQRLADSGVEAQEVEPEQVSPAVADSSDDETQLFPAVP